VRSFFTAIKGPLLGDGVFFLTIGQLPQAAGVIAITPASVRAMARIEFIRLCQSTPELTYALLERAHNNISNRIEQVEVAAFQNTTSQVAGLLHALWLETNRSRGSLGDLLRADPPGNRDGHR
jgi:CRP-like cAMP-binding protein